MLTVDNRQLQYRLDKLEADYRQESEKVGFNTPFKKIFKVPVLFIFKKKFLHNVYIFILKSLAFDLF